MQDRGVKLKKERPPANYTNNDDSNDASEKLRLRNSKIISVRTRTEGIPACHWRIVYSEDLDYV